MIQLSEIESQPLSTLICDFFICEFCGVIDRDHERMRSGYICPICKTHDQSGHLAFSIKTHLLIDLLQQTYHYNSSAQMFDAPHGRDVGVIIYFCTLRENLLNSFLTTNLRIRKIPDAIAERMLDDNRLANQRFKKLFPSIISESWDQAITKISNDSQEFKEISNLMLKVSESRNDFIHEGKAWGISRSLATECVNKLGELLQLFVALHNHYNHPVMRLHT